MPDAFPIAHPGADPDAGTDPHVPADADAPALPHADAQKDLIAQGPRVTAIVACLDDAGRILIVKQPAGPFAGAWLLPGGSIEPNERVEDAARRELLEETGYRVAELAPVAVYEVRSVPAGRFDFVVHLFRSGRFSGMPRPEPGSELLWADPGAADPHPSLAVALVDLGLIVRDRAAILRELERIGVEMRRVT
jgi:8-oxo-dGTP diphosphatase